MSMQIIKQSQCKKLSKQAKGMLSYDIAHKDTMFLFRVTANSGGIFSTEWLSLKSVQEAIPEGETFSAIQLSRLFKSSNANMPGFITAILSAEGLVEQVDGSQRIHQLVDDTAFLKSMSALVKKKVSLPDDVAQREAEKEAKRLELEKHLLAHRQKNAKPASGKSVKAKA